MNGKTITCYAFNGVILDYNLSIATSSSIYLSILGKLSHASCIHNFIKIFPGKCDGDLDVSGLPVVNISSVRSAIAKEGKGITFTCVLLEVEEKASAVTFSWHNNSIRVTENHTASSANWSKLT